MRAYACRCSREPRDINETTSTPESDPLISAPHGPPHLTPRTTAASSESCGRWRTFFGGILRENYYHFRLAIPKRHARGGVTIVLGACAPPGIAP